MPSHPNAAEVASAVLDEFGAPAVLTRPDSDSEVTTAVWHATTMLLSELGQIVDPRPSVSLPSALGLISGSTLVLDGSTFTVGRLISDNGGLARYWVS